MNLLVGPAAGWKRYEIIDGKITLLNTASTVKNFNFETGPVDHLFASLPDGWNPDLIFLERPEYASIPKNIENCPIPVVALVGDWNQGFTVLKDNLSKVDWIVVDKKGLAVFKNLSYKNVDYGCVYGFWPENHHLRPELERIYDVLLIGNFNFEIQRERERWLKRVALLNEKYHVKLLTNIFGEEYSKLFNQAKIIFNKSIRGEMNQRSFEAAANGALLFIEEDNLEITDFLEPGKECILYNDHNFEDLIDYYLNHENERATIAQAGYEKIQQFTYNEQLKQLSLYLEKKGIFNSKPAGRFYFRFSKSSQLYQNAKLAMQEISQVRLQFAREQLEEAIQLDRDNYEARNLLSMVLIIQMEKSDDEQERSRLFDQCINNYIDITEDLPNAGLVHYNLAYICQTIHRYDLAEAEFLKAIETTENDQPLGVYDYFFPRDYITFRMEWENIAATLSGEPERREKALKTLLRWHCCFNLGGLKTMTRQFEEGLDWYKKSATTRVDLAGMAYFKIGEIERLFGRFDEALDALNRCLALKPFTVDAWRCKAETLLKMGKSEEVKEFCEELMLMIKRCPVYQQNLEWILLIYQKVK